MKKIISFALLLSVFIFPVQSFALDSEYIKKRGDLLKVDVVAIILECKKENKTDKKAFKKCFALQFLEVRKELKNEQKEAKKECEEDKKCITDFVEKRMKSTTEVIEEEKKIKSTIKKEVKNIKNTIDVSPETNALEEKNRVTTPRKWRTSSHWRAEFYYCPKHDGWRGLSEKYLQEFSTEEELLKYYNRELHPECK